MGLQGKNILSLLIGINSPIPSPPPVMASRTGWEAAMIKRIAKIRALSAAEKSRPRKHISASDTITENTRE